MNVLDKKMWVYRHIAAWVYGFEAGMEGNSFDSNPYLKRIKISACNKCNMYREPILYFYEHYYCILFNIRIDDVDIKHPECDEKMIDLSNIWSMGYGSGFTRKGTDIKGIDCPCNYWQSLGADKDAKSLGWKRVTEPLCKFCNGSGILPELKELESI